MLNFQGLQTLKLNIDAKKTMVWNMYFRPSKHELFWCLYVQLQGSTSSLNLQQLIWYIALIGFRQSGLGQ